jgi:hypothetical protein
MFNDTAPYYYSQPKNESLNHSSTSEQEPHLLRARTKCTLHTDLAAHISPLWSCLSEFEWFSHTAQNIYFFSRFPLLRIILVNRLHRAGLELRFWTAAFLINLIFLYKWLFKSSSRCYRLIISLYCKLGTSMESIAACYQI